MFRKKQKHNDKTLIKGLKTDSTERQRFENYLYDTYAYLVKVGMRKHRLSENQALTAYADTILAVIRNIEIDRFRGESTIKTYLTGIFFRKCVDLIRSETTNRANNLQTMPIDDFFSISDSVKSVLEQMILKEKVETLTQKIQQLGKKCQGILEKWATGYSDKEIAGIAALNFKNAATVKTTRHRCLQKLAKI